ncbi:hypothetical protein RYH80_11930 [Halobaculum sp. MBLA0147]|uniref:DUF7095 family protein n=1 Tax=Halobaculum sp. MBLA0147 TaxID=3079934 RepID=UPI0035254349
MDRSAALDRVTTILDTVEEGPNPVPIREVWVYGDVALGLDPIDRLDVYVTKDLHLRGEADAAAEFRRSHGVDGVGQSVSAEWAREYPDRIRANDSGYAAPEKCLAAHLLPEGEPVHLEVCNAPFDDNVTRRLRAALERGQYDQVLDPRGVQLWADGRRAEETLAKLRGGELPFPTLSGAFEMLEVDDDVIAEIVDSVERRRADQQSASVRGDVV